MFEDSKGRWGVGVLWGSLISSPFSREKETKVLEDIRASLREPEEWIESMERGKEGQVEE